MKGFRVKRNVYAEMCKRYKTKHNGDDDDDDEKDTINYENKRYEEDPLYQLLYRPNERRLQPNGVYSDYIDRFLYTAVCICENKAGRALVDDALILRVYRSIVSENINDNALKILALWLLMWAEPVIIDFVRSQYKNTQYLEKFNVALPYMMQCIDKMLHSGFNIYNIRDKQRQLIYDELIPTYIVGPPIR